MQCFWRFGGAIAPKSVHGGLRGYNAARRAWLRLIGFACAVAALPAALVADDLPRIRWAGVSFSGDAAQVPQVYPNCHRIYETRDPETGDLVIERRMRDLLMAASPVAFALTVPGPTGADSGKMARGQGRQMALTLAIDGEQIETEQLGATFAIRIWLSAQLLVFDFEEAEILTCYPVAVLLSSATEQAPTDEQINQLVQQGIFGDSAPDSICLLGEAARIVRGIRPAEDSNRPKVQLAVVSIGDRAVPFLPSALQANQRPLQYFVANSFAKALSAETGIPVLPFVADSDSGTRQELARSGGTMAVLMRTVGDARVLQMKIPMPDYVFRLTVQGFKKVLASEKPGLKKWIYGAYIKSTFLEPESQTVYLEQSLVNPWFEDIPDETFISEWAAYQKSLHQLLSRFAENVRAEPSREWLKGQSGKALRDQLKMTAAKLQIVR